MVRIRIGKSEATIDGWVWRSENSALEGHLNGRLDPHGPGAEDPYPDYSAAEEAAALLGAEVLYADIPETDDDDGEERVY